MIDVEQVGAKVTGRTSKAPRQWPATLPAYAGLVIAAALILVHRYVSGLPRTQTTGLMPVDGLFSVAFVLALLFVAWIIGQRVLRIGALQWQASLERAVFSMALGLGVMAYATFAVASAGFLFPLVMLMMAGSTVVLLRSEVADVGQQMCAAGRVLLATCSAQRSLAVLIGLFGALYGLLALAVALLPPVGYDALWYHLAAPALFVQAHRLLILPSISQSNFPFTVELLYTLCLLFGDESGPGLVHLAFTILTVLGIWSFTAWKFDRRTAWLSVGAFITASEVIDWAPIPDIDLALTLYEFLATYAVLVWLQRRDMRWLMVGATMGGLAVACKYTAAPLVGILAILVVCADGLAPRRLFAHLGRGALLPTTAFIIVCPWLLKNTLAFHNPIFPLLASKPPNLVFGHGELAAPSVPATPVRAVVVWLTPLHLLQTGEALALTGRGLRDYLELPVQIFLKGDMEIFAQPSLLFLLAPLALFCRRDSVIIRQIALVAALMAVIWSVGLQELRYLLPAFPLFAILSGHALARLQEAPWRRPTGGRMVAVLVPMILVVSLAEYLFDDSRAQPLPVLLGQTSRDQYLRREVNSYAAESYLHTVLRPGEQALAIGESRGYYSPTPILLDLWRDRSTEVFIRPGSPDATEALLRNAHITYLLVTDASFHQEAMALPDHGIQLEALFHQYAQRHLQMIYNF